MNIPDNKISYIYANIQKLWETLDNLLKNYNNLQNPTLDDLQQDLKTF